MKDECFFKKNSLFFALVGIFALLINFWPFALAYVLTGVITTWVVSFFIKPPDIFLVLAILYLICTLILSRVLKRFYPRRIR